MDERKERPDGEPVTPDPEDDSDEARFARTQRPWTLRERLSMFFSGPLGDHRADTYSSLSPRKADGTRTRLFFFNGNGWGR